MVWLPLGESRRNGSAQIEGAGAHKCECRHPRPLPVFVVLCSTLQLQQSIPYRVFIRDQLSSRKTKSLPAWADRARRLRLETLGGITQEEFARRLGVSTSEVRRWEQGRRSPTPAQAIALGKAEGPPGCWFWWGLAGLSEQDVAAATGASGLRSVSGKGSGRVSPVTREALLSAVDTILERAPSAVIEEVARLLTDRAGKYGEPRPGRRG